MSKQEELAAYVQRVVDAAPPLSREQRDKIGTLMALPAPDELTARRLLGVLNRATPTNPGLVESAGDALSERLGQ